MNIKISEEKFDGSVAYVIEHEGQTRTCEFALRHINPAAYESIRALTLAIGREVDEAVRALTAPKPSPIDESVVAGANPEDVEHGRALQSEA